MEYNMLSLAERKADRIKRRQDQLKEMGTVNGASTSQVETNDDSGANTSGQKPGDNSYVDPTDLGTKTVKELRNMLTEKGLTAPQSASKAQLVELLSQPEGGADDNGDGASGQEGDTATQNGAEATGSTPPTPVLQQGANPWSTGQ